MTCIDACRIPVPHGKVAASCCFSARVAAVHAEAARESLTAAPEAPRRFLLARALAEPGVQPLPGDAILCADHRRVAGQLAPREETVRND